MGEGRKLKTEHTGAKNGGGYWGKREDAKRASRKRRRQIDKTQAQPYRETEAEIEARLAIHRRINGR